MQHEVAEAHNRAVTAEQEVTGATRQRPGRGGRPVSRSAGWADRRLEALALPDHAVSGRAQPW